MWGDSSSVRTIILVWNAFTWFSPNSCEKWCTTMLLAQPVLYIDKKCFRSAVKSQNLHLGFITLRQICRHFQQEKCWHLRTVFTDLGGYLQKCWKMSYKSWSVPSLQFLHQTKQLNLTPFCKHIALKCYLKIFRFCFDDAQVNLHGFKCHTSSVNSLLTFHPFQTARTSIWVMQVSRGKCV